MGRALGTRGVMHGRFDAGRRWRDARGRFARLPSPPAYAPPPMRYRLTLFGRPRGPWRDSVAEVKAEAIAQGLASWDASRREHYLAVPIGIEARDA